MVRKLIFLFFIFQFSFPLFSQEIDALFNAGKNDVVGLQTNFNHKDILNEINMLQDSAGINLYILPHWDDDSVFWPYVLELMYDIRIQRREPYIILIINFKPKSKDWLDFTNYNLWFSAKTSEGLVASEYIINQILNEVNNNLKGTQSFASGFESVKNNVQDILKRLNNAFKPEHNIIHSTSVGVPKVEFVRYSQELYGFDTLDFPMSKLKGYYNHWVVDSFNYAIPCKSIETGRNDYVDVKILLKDSSQKLDNLYFEDDKGIKYTIQATDKKNIYRLSLRSPGTDNTTQLYAKYKTKSKEGKDLEITAAVLDIMGFEKKIVNLTIVPVNGNKIIVSASDIQTALNLIYQSPIVEWKVSMHDAISVNGIYTGENNTFAIDNKMLSNYSPDMNTVIEKFIEKEALYNEESYYLFLVNKPQEPTYMGYMPKKKQFGFIFTDNIQADYQLIKTISHELGHGAFRLEHTFDEYGIPPQKTDNLMDYTDYGKKLWKPQWEWIHDPKARLYWFEGEDSRAFSLPCFGIFDNCDDVLKKLEAIKNAYQENKTITGTTPNSIADKIVIGNSLRVNGVDYDQLRLYYNLKVNEKYTINPKDYEDLDETINLAMGGTQRQRGISFLSDNKVVLKIIIEEDNEKEFEGKVNSIKDYLFGLDSTLIKINAAIEEMKEYLGNDYKQESGNLRTDLTDEGTEKMDCSEFMSRYLQKVLGLSSVPTYTTATMLDLIEEEDNNLQYVQGSDDNDFKDIKAGDVFLWRTESGGHTGVVVTYNNTTDQVTVIEAIGNSGASEESLSTSLDGYCKGCLRTSIYSRNGKALGTHKGWKGYFRPIIK